MGYTRLKVKVKGLSKKMIKLVRANNLPRVLGEIVIDYRVKSENPQLKAARCFLSEQVLFQGSLHNVKEYAQMSNVTAAENLQNRHKCTYGAKQGYVSMFQ